MPSSFTLGTHFEGFIKQQVNTGRYASASEVIRDSLRLLEEQDAMRQARLEALRPRSIWVRAAGLAYLRSKPSQMQGHALLTSPLPTRSSDASFVFAGSRR